MKFIDVFNTVKQEFSEDIAILVVSALTINLSTKIKKKDLASDNDSSFRKRIDNKTRTVLWEHSPETIDLVIEIRDALHEFQTRISMEGLGGCKVLTLKEIIENNKNKS